jgi:putative transposase
MALEKQANTFSRHSKTQLLAHFVWTTDRRMSWINEDIEKPLLDYIVGVCRRLGCFVEAIGAMDDHVRLLVCLGPEITIADLMRRVKGASSHYVHTQLGRAEFGWQRGYAVFGVSPQHRHKVAAYVRDQRIRHARGKLWHGAESYEPDTPPAHESAAAAD